MSLLAAATLVGYVWAAGAGLGLDVEAGTPDDLCPEKAATEAAIRGRLGGVLGRDGEGAWRARYTTWYAPEALGARVLRIEILDPNGRLQQTKDIHTAGATCESLAHAIAVVVESHFRRPDPGALPEERRPRLPLVSVGAGAATQSDGPAAGVAVEAGVRLARRAMLVAGAVVPRGHETQAAGTGSAELRGLPIRLGVAFDVLSRGRWGLDVGPEGLVRIDSAQTHDLTETSRLTRVVFGLGAAASARLALGPWSLGLTGSLVAPLPLEGSKLAVARPTGEVEVLPPPAVIGRVILGLSYGFFFSDPP
jgi:hypothetical protein